VIVDLVRRDVRSYRQLPQNLYQIQAKFRDEARGREFIMKDAYSFDVDEAAAQVTYRAMYDAYVRIFRRCGLDFRAVEADTGNIGGSMSHEFQVLADSGEDAIVSCSKCDYAANVEKAELRRSVESPAAAAPAELRRVPTPGKRTIDEVSAFLKVEPRQLLKTLIYLADEQPVAVLLRGDHGVNELKLKAALGCEQLFLAGDADVERATGAPVGFAGPVGLRLERVIADLEVKAGGPWVTGGNAVDVHHTGATLGRDFQVARFEDLRTAGAGDPCARCGEGVYRAHRGIEVGHVFFLGTKYSAPMACNFLDQDGKERPMVMGCYGIGVTRVAAAAIEQNHDANGIVWPTPLAPFHVAVLALQPADADVARVAEQIYRELEAAGVEVLYDDRDERPGSKFKDADLLGLPHRVVVGKKGVAEGMVELKARRGGGAARSVPIADAVREVVALVRAELA
jgi:prolyl-tRNA synthetase